MYKRVLHLLSQRPSLTGSGVTLDALVRRAGGQWAQCAAIGVPCEAPLPTVGDLGEDQVFPLMFGPGGDLPFPVPGMSDVMPYASSVWSRMTAGQLDAYRIAWRRHLADVVDAFRPDLIHVHHLWLLASMVKDVAPSVPVVSHSHSTGLRQMKLCPQLAAEVIAGCARNDRFAVLHSQLADDVAATVGVGHERVRVVGAGFRDDLFHATGRSMDGPPRLVYVGKYSAAKGVPWLLDAVERLLRRYPDLQLHVAGDGAGVEAESLRRRMQAMAPSVILHGMLTQPDLAALMRGCTVGVLPSMYEGVPLVLAEAFACGCRVVATALPGVERELAPHMGDALHTIALPRLVGPDTPDPADLDAFVDALTDAIDETLARPPLRPEDIADRLQPLTWDAVFERVQSIWVELLSDTLASTDRGSPER